MNLPKARNEVNINTIIQVIGFLIVIGGMGATWGSYASGQLILGEKLAAAEARIKSTEAGVLRIDNIAYRVTVLEQSTAQATKALEELRTAVASQGADIRVIREIMTRIDQQMQPTRR